MSQDPKKEPEPEKTSERRIILFIVAIIGAVLLIGEGVIAISYGSKHNMKFPLVSGIVILVATVFSCFPLFGNKKLYDCLYVIDIIVAIVVAALALAVMFLLIFSHYWSDKLGYLDAKKHGWGYDHKNRNLAIVAMFIAQLILLCIHFIPLFCMYPSEKSEKVSEPAKDYKTLSTEPPKGDASKA